jgi:holliday junction DNA helicase RuvB
MGRPAKRFHGFIGHKRAIDPIRRELAGAIARGEPTLHVLLTGVSGVGKTRLAEALAEERGTRLLRVMGYAPREVLTRKLLALKPCDFLLIDEGHGLKASEQELLFEAIDHQRLKKPSSKGSKGKQMTPKTRHLEPFTLVLATDRPGQLLNPLKKRFPTKLHLTPYPSKEMKEIVAVVAAESEILLTPQATSRLAMACHGLPRKATHFLQKLRLFYPPQPRDISIKQVERFLRAFHIDEHGFGPEERKYLRFLRRNGKASLETLAQYMGTDRDEVLRQIEPTLVRKGLVSVASSGRRLTAKGQKWYGSKGSNQK